MMKVKPEEVQAIVNCSVLFKIIILPTRRL